MTHQYADKESPRPQPEMMLQRIPVSGGFRYLQNNKDPETTEHINNE